MATMKSLVFHGKSDIRLKEMLKPKLTKPTDALVKVTTSTICGSDLHIWHGHLPITPGTIAGHEFVNKVEEVGNCTKVALKANI